MKQKQYLKIMALILFVLTLAACSSSGGDEPESRVFFTNLNDGDTVDSPVTVHLRAIF